MTGRPLDEFDPSAVGIGEPGGPEVVGTARGVGRGCRDVACSKTSDRIVQCLYLGDEVVEAYRVDPPCCGIVDKLEADELVLGSFSIVRLPKSVSGTVPQPRTRGSCRTPANDRGPARGAGRAVSSSLTLARLRR